MPLCRQLRRGALLLLAVCLAGALLVNSRAQTTLRDDPEYLIDSWDTESGLPDDSVTAIAQDDDGYLWIGTFGGLARFDGVHFAVFDPGNTPELPSAGTVSLHYDRSGRLWVSTTEGLVRRDGDQWKRFGKEDGWTGNFVRTFTERDNGELLLTTFDGHVLTFADGRLTALPAPPGEAGQGYFGAVGGQDAWWVVQNRFIGQWNGTTWIRSITPDKFVRRPHVACTSAQEGGIWVLFSDQLVRHDGQNVVERRLVPQWSGGVWSIFEDRSASIWICTDGDGLYRLTPDGDTQNWDHATGLGHNHLRFVFEDREGSIWIGTNGGGLRRFKPRRIENMGLGSDLSQSVTRAVAPSASGGVWIATFDNGLLHHDRTALRRIPVPGPDDLSVYGVCVLEDRSGRVWYADQDTCWWRPPGARSFERPSFPPGAGITFRAIFEDSQDRIWIATTTGVLRFDGAGFHTLAVPPELTTQSVACFAEDRDGALWMAAPNGVFRVAGDVLTELRGQNGQPLRNVVSLTCEPDGTTWLGTRREGLWRWRDGQIDRIGTAQGLPVHGIHGIVADDTGHFWMPSDNGIVRAAREDLVAVAEGRSSSLACQLLDRRDGLPSDQCPAGQRPCARDSDGRLWFATARGIAAVEPERFRLNPLPPPVHIEALTYRVPDRGRDRTGRSATQTAGAMVEIRAPISAPVILPPGSRRLEIDYTALSFSAPEKVNFQIMLDGISGGWEDVGTLRSATFFELRPGDYTFRVRAANGDGTWNEEGAELAFSVQPFYWQSLWFQTAATALIIAALGGTAWWQLHTRHLRRVARLQREQRQQAELAHVSRLSLLGELSASMAHELNQPLTAILANSQAAQRFMANGEPDLGEFREILKDIASDTTRARDVIRNLRTLVKKGDFSPVALDLNDIISEVIGFLHGDIVNRNVTVSLELASDLPPVLGDRVQLQQVLLNLLINAFDAVGDKPADERLVTIRTALDDETAVRVSVRDRGIGMAPERLAQLFQAFYTTKKNGLGMGLSVTRSIVEAHRGRIWAEPNPDAGMAFHFTVPLAKSAS